MDSFVGNCKDNTKSATTTANYSMGFDPKASQSCLVEIWILKNCQNISVRYDLETVSITVREVATLSKQSPSKIFLSLDILAIILDFFALFDFLCFILVVFGTEDVLYLVPNLFM